MYIIGSENIVTSNKYVHHIGFIFKDVVIKKKWHQHHYIVKRINTHLGAWWGLKGKIGRVYTNYPLIWDHIQYQDARVIDSDTTIQIFYSKLSQKYTSLDALKITRNKWCCFLALLLDCQFHRYSFELIFQRRNKPK